MSTNPDIGIVPGSALAPTEETAIAWVERRFGRLPDDFKAFLRNHGSVRVDDARFAAADSATYRLVRFVPFTDERSWGLTEPGVGPETVVTLVDGEHQTGRGLFGGERLVPIATICEHGTTDPDENCQTQSYVDFLCIHRPPGQAEPIIAVWHSADALDYLFDCEDVGGAVDYSRFTTPVAPDFTTFLTVLAEGRQTPPPRPAPRPNARGSRRGLSRWLPYWRGGRS